jgi:hypothetical protein
MERSPTPNGRLGGLAFEVNLEGGTDLRLSELIVYIAERCENDPSFGAIKLNKILWYSDFWSYAFCGKPITGAEYMSLPQGPAPKRLLPLRKKLEADGSIVVRKKSHYGHTQQRVIPLRRPDLDIFSGRDISTVNEQIHFSWGDSAAEVSEASHGIGWKIAGNKGRIPYQAIFLSDDPLTEYDIVRTQELSEELGWEEREEANY